MAKKRFGIEFKGFEEMFSKFDGLGGDIRNAAEKCLEFIPSDINPNLEADIAKHKKWRKSGNTAQSIKKDAGVTWEGYVASIPVGFDIAHGGLASIFLMYGTARHAPANQYGKYPDKVVEGVQKDEKLYNDIYGTSTKSKINKKQADIMSEAIRKKMGE